VNDRESRMNCKTTRTNDAPFSEPAVAEAPCFWTENRRFDVWRRFRRNWLALAGLAIILILVFISIAAPLVAPGDPNEVSYNLLQGPSREHWLGTDDNGRDELTRLIYASRISLAVGVSVSLATVVIGTLIGGVAGFYGKQIDAWLSGLINVMLSIPMIPLAMVLGAFLKKDLLFIIGILAVISWTATARLIRAEFICLREREYVTAARSIGATGRRIMFTHMLPNAVAPIIVAATLGVANAILAESALSYLGYGIQPPIPSWGNMLQNAQAYLRNAPLMAVWPGAMISLTVVSINFVGDGLRDALDPRLRNVR
jgi:peptide/nickel transport system permease protein